MLFYGYADASLDQFHLSDIYENVECDLTWASQGCSHVSYPMEYLVLPLQPALIGMNLCTQLATLHSATELDSVCVRTSMPDR